MFGYLIANIDILDKKEKQQYRSFYCGLCNRLKDKYGLIGVSTLTYDLTFVVMLLTDVYKPVNEIIEERCIVHPIKKHLTIFNSCTEYAASMNIYLSYYKHLDDVNDDNSFRARIKADKLKQFLKKIETEYPVQTAVIKENLHYISNIEKENILNPDLGSNAFGNIMACLLDKENNNENLRGCGYHLGKFIYLVDAVIDFKRDLKKEAYNPLVALENYDRHEMLLSIMDDCDSYYSKLQLQENKNILDNIFYSGIWTQYQLHKIKQEKGERK
ncbi:MAG: DUF5685 family protein [Erysipelotrichaceae bacterium]|jgi:hypothetical protein